MIVFAKICSIFQRVMEIIIHTYYFKQCTNIVDNNDNGNIIETSSNTNTGGSSPSYGYSLDLDIPYSFEQDIIPTSGYDI